jgi:hypothetical protein
MSLPNPPQQLAGARGTRAGTFPISLLGAPIQLFQPANVNLAAGTTTLITPISPSPVAGYQPCNQVGYEISIDLQAATNTGNTAPFCLVTLTFYDDDSPTALPVDRIQWYLPVSAAGATVYPVSGHGPLRGQYMTLSFTNLDPAVALSFSAIVRGSSRTYSRDDWRWQISGGAAVPGYVLPIFGGGQALVIATAVPIILQGGSQQIRLIPLFAGRVLLSWSITGLTSNAAQFTIAPVNTSDGAPVYASPLAGQAPASGLPPSTTVELALPRDLCVLTMTNLAAAGGGNAQFSVVIVAEEY